MRKDKKGMTMALGVIIAIVVLIVVALAVITITTGSLTRFFGSTSATTDRTGADIEGTAKCTSCAFKWTKATVSTLDDQVIMLPIFCEDTTGAQYCCTDMAHLNCKEVADCGVEEANADVIWETCSAV